MAMYFTTAVPRVHFKVTCPTKTYFTNSLQLLVRWTLDYYKLYWCFIHFSAPEPKAQVHYCDHALSVVRPSVVNFSHFQLLLWYHWTEFNETWQYKARSQHPLPSLCFLGRAEKQDGRPGLWLAETFSNSPLKPLNRIRWNLTGRKISRSSTKFDSNSGWRAIVNTPIGCIGEFVYYRFVYMIIKE